MGAFNAAFQRTERRYPGRFLADAATRLAKAARHAVKPGGAWPGGRGRRNRVSSRSCLAPRFLRRRLHVSRARSSMDRVLPSEGRGCWFDPSRARHLVLLFSSMRFLRRYARNYGSHSHY